MSLVSISNTHEQIDFNKLEYLVWEDGWNGGEWNNWDVIDNPTSYDFFVVNDQHIYSVNAFVLESEGVDSDMGHRYYWKSNRVYVKDYGVFGETLIDSQNMQNGYKIMYCKRNGQKP